MIVRKMATPPGLEPRHSVPKTEVLPLHHGVVRSSLSYSTWCTLIALGYFSNRFLKNFFFFTISMQSEEIESKKIDSSDQ